MGVEGLMAGPKGNSEFVFPLALPQGTLWVLGKQNSLFPFGTSHEVLSDVLLAMLAL